MSAARWGVRTAVGEGLRSAYYGRWATGALLLLSTWSAALLGALDARFVHGVIEAERAWITAGAHTMIIRTETADLPRASCDALDHHDSVAAVALQLRTEPVSLTAAPGARVPVVDATAGIWQLLGISTGDGTGVIVAEEIADRLGLQSGDLIEFVVSGREVSWDLPAGPLAVRVADTAILGPEMQGVIITTSAAGNSNFCLVVAAPSAYGAIRAAGAGVIDAPDPARVLDRLSSSEFTENYAQQYSGRQLRWAWLANAFAVSVAWVFALWVRRSDFALYTTLGADRADTAVVGVSAWSALVAVATVWSVSLGFIVAVALGASADVALAYVSRHCVATALLAAAVTTVASPWIRPPTLAALKDV